MKPGPHRSRLITAAVALPLLALCVWQGGALMLALVTAGSLAGLWEFQGLFPGAPMCARGLSLALGALMCWLGFRFGPAAALAVLPAAFWLEELTRLWHGTEGKPRWYLAASLAYIPASLQFVPGFSPAETALVLLAVMASDTGAYYAGTLIGGPKIWPSVSPKKTWAGSFGSLAATVAWCLAFGALRGTAPLACFAALGAALAVAAQMGDFMESALKRTAGVKDSGALLPGHGGVLDRIDGMLPAILVYALARNLFGPL
ncbi:phosphatidate cytidylyltransferase [Fundidesulfovibrio soli]|uniref:phosphatidate cytidylyltransferase n=1 Tax=Fundidesulfovibrio soli TaxID=2922716 RepID=UPI001FAFBB8B|nr:phosphatidate cytidylyltransferase [Fundidesulfovibrio soli]